MSILLSLVSRHRRELHWIPHRKVSFQKPLLSTLAFFKSPCSGGHLNLFFIPISFSVSRPQQNVGYTEELTAKPNPMHLIISQTQPINPAIHSERSWGPQQLRDWPEVPCELQGKTDFFFHYSFCHRVLLKSTLLIDNAKGHCNAMQQGHFKKTGSGRMRDSARSVCDHLKHLPASSASEHLL